MTRNIDDNDDNYDNNIKKSNGYNIKNHNDDNFSTLMLPQKLLFMHFILFLKMVYKITL